ncbi:MAG: hypothetical protein JO165_11760 [Candidatus Eremiobacteraeota bacterium]|nr:hypothetical protein [Candidatus Eremiobacteraeota bacterium]
MRRSSKFAFVASVLLLNLPSIARADPPQIYAGLQGLAVVGVHKDVAGSQHGAGAGALLQLGVFGARFGVKAEGIPPVSIPQAPSRAYGQATPQLSVFNGAARFAVAPDARIWLGFGATVINEKTPLPAMHQTVASRLAGARYEAAYRHEFLKDRFVEMQFGGAPRLSGSDIYTYSDGSPNVVKPEVASEEDGSLALGVRKRNTEWLVGFRTINFSAKYSVTGQAADRNNGGGVMLEWRCLVRP